MHNSHFFIFLICISIASSLNGQTTLPTEKVDVIKDFEVRLKDSEKKEITPTLPPLDTAIKSQFYNIQGKLAEIEYPGPSIRPLAVSKDKIPEGNNGYLKVGGSIQFGLQQFLLDNTKNISSQKTGRTSAHLKGTYFGKKGSEVYIQGGYNSNLYHYYGYQFLPEYDPSTIYEEDAIAQKFRRLSFSTFIENNAKNKLGLTYQGGIQLYRLKDNFLSRERNFRGDVAIQKWFGERHDLSIKAGALMNNYRDTTTQKLSILEFSPSFTFRHRSFSLKGGASLFQDEMITHIFPNIELKGMIIPGILMIQAGIKGEIAQENMDSYTRYNPFTNMDLSVVNAKQTQFYGLVTGEINKISYQAKINYLNTSALPIFVSKNEQLPRFEVILDTASILSFEGNLSFPINEKFKFDTEVISRVYDTKNEEKAWHRPGFEFNTQLTYRSKNQKLTSSISAVAIGKIAYSSTENLIPILEINVGGEYRITDNLKIFGQVNNLTNQTNERWLYYRRFGINPSAGLSLIF
jgi:hypothetical protein